MRWRTHMTRDIIKDRIINKRNIILDSCWELIFFFFFFLAQFLLLPKCTGSWISFAPLIDGWDKGLFGLNAKVFDTRSLDVYSNNTMYTPNFIACYCYQHKVMGLWKPEWAKSVYHSQSTTSACCEIWFVPKRIILYIQQVCTLSWLSDDFWKVEHHLQTKNLHY